MRNSTLATVRLMVKAETGKSLSPQATAQDTEINQLIANVQATLAVNYTWPFLKSRWDSFVPAGTRFQAFPTNLSPQGGAVAATAIPNFERPMTMEVKWNNIWQPVVYGIDEIPEMNYLDPDRNQVLDPVQRWQFSDEALFEVWPLPASQAQVRFIGQRQLTALQIAGVWEDAATCDLDDLLITLFVAADYLLREEKPNAQAKAGQAQRRLFALLGAYPGRAQIVTIGRGMPMDRKVIRQIPLVMVAGGQSK